MKSTIRIAGLAAAALAAVVVLTGPAHAETEKCQRTILKEAGKFFQAKAKILSKCEEDIIKGKFAGPCPDPKSAEKIAKASGKLASGIGKKCGGDDKVCGGDLTNEDSPASVGWPSQCPNFERGTCDGAIDDCSGIASCLECVSEAAVDQAMSLYYDDLETSNDKAIVKCQKTLGKETTKFLIAKSKILQKCWDARIKGKHGNACPDPGDGKALVKIQKAETKLGDKLCKACGGADKTCGTGDDLTPAQIGFAADCPAVTVPGGAACGGPIASLQDIVDCVTCVTEFKVDCVDANQVPNLTGYPSECNVCTAPDPVGACPTVLEFTANGSDADLDTGWTGIANDMIVPSNGRLTLTVSGCAGGSHPDCGQCSLSGPITNAGGTAFNNQRCADATWIECTSDLDCTLGGASGPCVFFFGSPLPLSAGNVPVCVTNEVTAPVTGTVDIDTGNSSATVKILSRVHTTGTVFHPCPQCVAGVCSDGPRAGQPCTVNGSNIFGDLSFDCPPPPGANSGNLDITLVTDTGTQTRTLTVDHPNCRAIGFTSNKCFCDTCNNANAEACSSNADCPDSPLGTPGVCGGRRCLGGSNNGLPCVVGSDCPGGACGHPGGVSTASNACVDGICTPTANDEGECQAGPVDQFCSKQPFRACTVDTDCDPHPVNCPECLPGQTCVTKLRDCYTDNGAVGGSVAVTGLPDTPCDLTSKPTIGSLFCIPPTGSSSVNSASGLPGLGRLLLPGVAVLDP